MDTRVCSCSCGCIGIRRGSLGSWVLISACQFLTSVIWAFSPHFPVRSFTCHLWRGLEVKDRVTGTTVGPLVPGNGVELNHASSIFHFLDQPPPFPSPATPAQTLQRILFFSFPGSTQPSCMWVVWLLVTGLCSGKLRSVNSFLHRVAAGTHQISREGEPLCHRG